MTADVVVLVGNPRPGARTRALAEAVASAVVTRLPTVLDGQTTLDLAEIAAVSFGPEAVKPAAPVDDAHGTVRAARLLVVGTPTYKGSYAGLLKLFLDQYGHNELAGVVAVPVAIAAAPPHRAAVSAALTALLGELGAAVPAGALAVLEGELVDVPALAGQWAATHAAELAQALSS